MKRINLLATTFNILIVTVSILWPWNNVLALTGRYSGWNMGHGRMEGWGMEWFGMIFMLIFWILIIAGLVFFIKWLLRSTEQDKAANSGNNRAFEILRERYAMGEINKQQFENMIKDLNGK